MNHSAETRAPAAPLPKTLFGYDVLDRLGEGAGSTIYAVSDPKTSQVYAMKHLLKKVEKDQRFIEQAENEFKVSQGFKHPVLRKSYEFKVGRTLFFKVNEAALVMEMVEGVPLQLCRPTGIKTILDTFVQVAMGLGALHYQRLVHCDLKPGNILLNERDGSVRLIDFGQTVKADTVKERVQGTPDFIAPEQVKLKPVTVQTDIFNYGATLYWTLTGKHVPTLFTTHKSERSKLESQQFPTPRDLNPETPELLSKIVMKCVRMFPGDRPEEMTELGKMLETMVKQLA